MTRVDELLQILSTAATQEYFGEPVSQLEHALQTAHCAVTAGVDDETVAAALLHDIGHLVASDDHRHADGVGVIDHDHVGSQYLRQAGFSDRLLSLVEGHVQAKRYLTATDANYIARLSEASTRTLALQGGPMTESEAADFRNDPLFRAKLQLRVWDERAKEPGLSVPGIETYRPLLARLLASS